MSEVGVEDYDRRKQSVFLQLSGVPQVLRVSSFHGHGDSSGGDQPPCPGQDHPNRPEAKARAPKAVETSAYQAVNTLILTALYTDFIIFI